MVMFSDLLAKGIVEYVSKLKDLGCICGATRRIWETCFGPISFKFPRLPKSPIFRKMSSRAYESSIFHRLSGVQHTLFIIFLSIFGSCGLLGGLWWTLGCLLVALDRHVAPKSCWEYYPARAGAGGLGK